VRVLAWPFLFKNYSIRDLAEFLEIYGLPMRLGKYPEGASDKEKSTLLRAVMSIGHNAGGVIPKGMDIEFEKAAEGGADPFMAMINWCEKSQSKAILGGTLTSQADGKSSTNALGNVHNEVRQEIRDADLKALAATLTRDLVYPLYALNGKSYSNQHRIPRFEFDLTEPENLTTFVEPLEKLTGLGVSIPVSWVYDKTKIPQPKEGEAILQQASPVAVAPLAALKSKVETKNEDTENELLALTDNLAEQAESESNGFLTQLKQIVDSADSFEQMQSQLLALSLADQGLAEIMGQALTVASIAGRYDLLQDAH
jgi:phage gp29-like protein